MEPGIPTAESIETKTGHYNLDAKMRFWATPPFHGVLRESVVHPAGYTYKLPDNVSFAEGAITAVNFASEDLGKVVAELTGGRGVNIVFECSGNRKVAESAFDNAAPGGTVIFVGLPDGPIQYDVLQGSVKEIRVEHVFRYTDVYDRAEALMGSGKIDVKPLLTDRYPFDRAVDAIHAFLNMAPNSVKIQIDMVSEI
jgi:threonine dehydrogenase-like Zn-dependent dehydrogenase